MNETLNPADAVAELLKGLTTKVAPAKKEQPFENFVVYSPKGKYLGNFSLPENFTEGTKEAVMAFMANCGLDLRAPGSTKQELTLDDL